MRWTPSRRAGANDVSLNSGNATATPTETLGPLLFPFNGIGNSLTSALVHCHANRERFHGGVDELHRRTEAEGGRVNHVVVDAEDALIAALETKSAQPEALIMYVRPQNRRGDACHPFLRAQDTR
jgi:hypothetical protein